MQRLRMGGVLRVTVIAMLLAGGGALVRLTAGFPSDPPMPRVDCRPVARPPLPPAPPGDVTRQVRIRDGETFVAALGRLGFSPADAYGTAMALRPVYAVGRVYRGHELQVVFRGGRPLRLEYAVDPATRLLGRWRPDGGLEARLKVETMETRLAFVNGEIQSSLFEGILAAGEDAALADLLASLFEFDIDFNRDIRAGDTFRLLVEKRFLRGTFQAYGRVYAAAVTNRGRTIRIVAFTDSKGHTAWFHPDGRSVRKMFLRCPLPFMRVTSRYGNRRHPVLGFSARHNGIDLGAPRGTPVKATGTGVVTQAGVHRLKGRYVQLRHPNGYETHYYHLSGIAAGVRRGRTVTQGQVIGYVGNTGLSTGPHLHYGVRHNGRFINPLRLRAPSKAPVPAAEMTAFRRRCSQVFFSMTAFAWIQARGLHNPVAAPAAGEAVETAADSILEGPLPSVPPAGRP